MSDGFDEGGSSVIRYRVTHRTLYKYSDDVTSSYGRGYLTPRDTDWQRCESNELIVEPEPSDSSTGRDVYGNLSSYFHVTTPHRELSVTARSVVDVSTPRPPAAGWEQAWELARPAFGESTGAGAFAAEFVLDLVPPEITDDVRAYAAVSFTAGRPLGEAVVDLMGRIYRDFQYRSGSTTISTKVSEVLAAGEGVCQDFARMAATALRTQGLAARYVSGYLATNPPPGQPRLVGADATHAWAAVWVPPDGWVAFDPTNDTVADERYVTVAWGRDYADVPPLRGIIYTDSDSSTIKVSVDVAPCEESPAHA
ncbi:transglutaminase family protein [Mycobacteroides salmoniphilum]|uniref:transglutaminase family protein n=1 Tax=Mycobacteroides salmoniphilum TaxID=404941 RepID=UPI0009941316|nr:transglutaminase family protein [Mycobacteroides salmoniphilum]